MNDEELEVDEATLPKICESFRAKEAEARASDVLSKCPPQAA